MSSKRITLDICRNGLAIDLIVSEAYSETCQTSKMELFAKRVNGWLPLTFFAKKIPSQIPGGILNTPWLLKLKQKQNKKKKFQKQPPDAFCIKIVVKNFTKKTKKFTKIHKKTPVLESFFKETTTQVFSYDICEIFKEPVM